MEKMKDKVHRVTRREMADAMNPSSGQIIYSDLTRPSGPPISVAFWKGNPWLFQGNLGYLGWPASSSRRYFVKICVL